MLAYDDRSGPKAGRLSAVLVGVTLVAILATASFGSSESVASTTTSTHRDPCDGMDNDGDGTSDERWVTVLGTPAPTTREGVPDGTWICAPDGQGITNSTLWDPPIEEDELVELCNGLDDDADSLIDEAWPLRGDPTPFGGDWVCGADWTSIVSTVWTETTPPTVDLLSPEDGASYPQGSFLMAFYECDNPGSAFNTSLMATCAGDVASGSPIDTSVAGVHTFTVIGEDAVGNRTTESVSYTVTAPSGGGGDSSGGPGTAPAQQPTALQACLAGAKKKKGKAKRKRAIKRCRTRFS